MPIELGEDGQDWRVWQALLPNNGSPKRDTDVSTGYWRIESAKAFATPVRTVFEDGMMMVYIGAKDGIDRDCGDDWHRFCTNQWPKVKASGFEDFEQALETGFWQDGLATTSRDSIGGNEGPEDAVEQMLREARENIEKAAPLIEAGTAKTKKDADAAAILKEALTSPKAKLEAAHKLEKEPHLEAGRAVDRKYLDLVKEMKKVADDIHRAVIRPFLIEQERIANEAAAAAQKVIDDANEAARKAAEVESGAAVSDEDWQAAAPVQATVTVPKVSAGTKGTKASLRDVKYGEITDFAAFAAAVSGDLVLRETLKAMANKLARQPTTKDGDTPCAGMKVVVRRE